MRESRQYLGLELAGAKNQKTALAVLEYYPKERKVFLLDIFDKIAPGTSPATGADQTGDEVLLELIADFAPATMGVNVPLGLPSCVLCERRSCPLPSKCTVAEVKWMREFSRRAYRQHAKKSLREFTPYTQRPVELFIRHEILAELPASHRFEVDEALGGNKAPLTARMGFLLRHLENVQCLEVWPKLTVSLLAIELGLGRRLVSSYRNLEEGVHAREEILEHLVKDSGVFIYERDIHKLGQSLPAFDAFICAYTALLKDEGKCVERPTGFPPHAGWVAFPAVTPC